MDQQRINREEQSCISNCIYKYWGSSAQVEDDEKRDHEYEQCLTDCRICR